MNLTLKNYSSKQRVWFKNQLKLKGKAKALSRKLMTIKKINKIYNNKSILKNNWLSHIMLN